MECWLDLTNMNSTNNILKGSMLAKCKNKMIYFVKVLGIQLVFENIYNDGIYVPTTISIKTEHNKRKKVADCPFNEVVKISVEDLDNTNPDEGIQFSIKFWSKTGERIRNDKTGLYEDKLTDNGEKIFVTLSPHSVNIRSLHENIIRVGYKDYEIKQLEDEVVSEALKEYERNIKWNKEE